jgi:hypothetical protein
VKKVYIWKNFDALREDRNILPAMRPDNHQSFQTPADLYTRRESLAPGTGYAQKCEQNGIIGFEIELTQTIQPTTANENIPTISLDAATTLASTYLTSTLLHCQQVAHCMRYFAQKKGLSDTVCTYRYIV